MSESGEWSGNERGDGARIVKGIAGYGVISASGVHVWNCPYCGGDIESTATARLVADKLFPVVEVAPSGFDFG